MNEPDDAPSSERWFASYDRLRWVILITVGCAILLPIGIVAWDSWRKYEASIEAAEEQADNLANILLEHMRRTVAAVDASLTQIVVAGQRLGGPGSADPAWNAVLTGAFAGMSGIGSLTVVDTGGVVRYSTVPQIVGQSRRDRYLLSTLPQSRGLAADTPFRSLLSGEPLIPLGRRLETADGSYAGAVVATLRLHALRDFYESVDVGRGGSIRILHPDGQLLLSEPATPGAIGEMVRDSAVYRAWRDNHPRGILHEELPSDGREVITAWRTLANPAMLLAVSFARATALEDWRHDAVISALILFALTTALLAAAAAALRLVAVHRNAQGQILRRDRQLHLAQSIARMGSVTYNASSGTVNISPQLASIFGWSTAPETVSFDAFLAPVSDADRTRVREALTHCASAGAAYQMEFRIDRSDGEERDIWSEGFRDQRSTRESDVVAIWQDVTEQRIAERRLSEAQKMEAVGQLTGGVAHDFNNLLTVVIGNVGLLAERVGRDPRMRELADAVQRAAERGAELTRNLLAFARKQPLQPAVVSLNDVVADVQQLLHRTLGEHIDLETALNPDLWPAHVDPAQLQTAIVNLAVNARDAMPDGGRLTIETGNAVLDDQYIRTNPDARAGSYAMLAVSDTGTGIPPNIVNRVFEPFFTTKEVGKGTGLGLSMVYGFVKQTGGHIKIYSEMGHGTSVKLYLPRAEHGSTSEPETESETAVRGHETLLVVEDDPLVRDFVVQQLGSFGYDVLVATDGIEALAVLDTERPVDLLFTDVVLPGGMNGRQLAEAARRRRPDLKVLFTSGYTENAIVHGGQLDRGVMLLTKPYRLATLLQRIREALAHDPA